MMGVALMVGNDVFFFPGDHSMVLLGTNLLDVGITEGRKCKGNPSWQIVQPFEKKTKENRFCKNMAKQLPVLFM